MRHWDYAITFTVEIRFQIQAQFWIPQGKLHGACYILGFFCKTSKHPRLTSHRVLVFPRGFWVQYRPFELKNDCLLSQNYGMRIMGMRFQGPIFTDVTIDLIYLRRIIFAQMVEM